MSDSSVLQLVTIIAGAVVSIATIVGNVMTYRKTAQTHELVNSSSSQLLALTRSAAHAQGMLDATPPEGPMPPPQTAERPPG